MASEINEIINRQYHNFKGRRMKDLGIIHSYLRDTLGDEKYLEFLKRMEKENPKPVYNSVTNTK
jgi:hypothetical protein